MVGSGGSGGQQANQPLRRFIHPIDVVDQGHHPNRPVPLSAAASHDSSGWGEAPSGLGREVECDVDDHVFLTADESAPPDLDEDFAGVESVGGRTFRVPEEAGVNARVAQSGCLPVHLHRTVLQRPDDVVSRVLQLEQMAVVLPSGQV